MDYMDDRNVQELDVTSPLAALMVQQELPAAAVEAPQASPAPQGSMNPGILNKFQNFANSPQNGDLLLAMAGGFGGGRTPLEGLGRGFAAAHEHFQYQDKLKMLNEQRKDALQLKQDQLAEQKRLNSSKITAFAAKAAKDGMPKKIGGMGGQTTLLWPSGEITSHSDEEVQKIWETAEAAKTERAALLAGTKAQVELLTNPKVLEADKTAIKDVKQAEEAYTQFERVKQMMEQSGGISFASRMAPEALSAWINRGLGTEDGKLMAEIDNMNLDGFISYVSGFPGALSDKEGAQIKSAMPKKGDHPSLWAAFFERHGPALERALKIAREHEAKRSATKEEVKSLPSYLNGGKPQLKQQYPKGFNPPSDGRSSKEEQAKIIEAELKDEEAKPESPTKQSNLKALRADLERLGYTPKTTTSTQTTTQRRPIAAFGSP